MNLPEALKPAAQAASEIITTPAVVAYNAGRAVCQAVTTIPAMHSEMVAMRQELTEVKDELSEVNTNLRAFDGNMGEQMEAVRQEVENVPVELGSILLPLQSLDKVLRPWASRQEARRLRNGSGLSENGASAKHEPAAHA